MPNSAYDVQKTYLAYFGRPADPAGLAYWMNADSSSMLTAFSESSEHAALYAGMNAAQRINQIYQNLLGRSAEPLGVLYWENEIATGRVTLANLALAIQSAAQGNDALTIANRIDYATQFTAGLDSAALIEGYRGDTAAGSARGALSAVVSSGSSLLAALNSLQTTLATVCGTSVPNGPIVMAPPPRPPFVLSENDHAVTLVGTSTDAFTYTINGAATRAGAAVNATSGSLTNSVTSFNAANYDGPTTITLASGANSVTGGAGADTVIVGGLKLTGTLSGLNSADTLTMTNGSDISGANGGNGIGAGTAIITGAVTMTAKQHDGNGTFSTIMAPGSADQITLTTAGMTWARAGIEAYVLAGGTFSPDATTPGVNAVVTGGESETLWLGYERLTGTYTGFTRIRVFGGSDDAPATGGDISGATFSGTALQLQMSGSNAKIALTEAQYEAFAAITSTGSNNRVTITTSGASIASNAAIDGYTLNGTGNTLTLDKAQKVANVTGSAGTDTVDVGTLGIVSYLGGYPMPLYGVFTGIENLIAADGANISGIKTDSATKMLTMAGSITMTATTYQGLTTINAPGSNDRITAVGLTGGALLNSAVETFDLGSGGDVTSNSAQTIYLGTGNRYGGGSLKLAGTGNDTVYMKNSTLVSTSTGNLTIEASGNGTMSGPYSTSITTGSGNDTINASSTFEATIAAGAGADTIKLGSYNTYRIGAATDGGGANATTGYDILSGFSAGGNFASTIQLSALLDAALGGGTGAAGIETANVFSDELNTTGTIGNATTDILVLSRTTVTTDADLTTLASVVSAIGKVSMDANDEVMAVINVAGNGGFGVYHIKATAAIAYSALTLGVNAELRIVGVHTGDLSGPFTTANLSNLAY